MVKGFWSATILGGIIAWLIVSISWAVLPWHCSQLNPFKDEASIVEALEANTSKDGIYVIPHFGCMKELPTQDEIIEDLKSQDLETTKKIFVSINHSGFKDDSVIPYIVGLVTYIVCALFISLIVMQMAANSYGWKVLSITIIGLVVGILGNVPMWNWMGYPLSMTLLNIIDAAVSWFVAGIFMAALIRIKKHPSI